MSLRLPAEGRRLGVALLGSTGSIGRQAVEVLERHADRFRVVALATGRNAAALEAQVRRLHPAVAALADPSAPLDLPSTTRRVMGNDALVELATRDDVDLVVVATGGVVSLRPTLAALAAGKVVATANKETLVAGGHLVMPEARRNAAGRAASDPGDPLATPLAWLRPVDSEHSAIWQCLVGEPPGGSPGWCSLPRAGHSSRRPRPSLRRSPRSRPSTTRPGRWGPRSPSTPRRSPTRAWR